MQTKLLSALIPLVVLSIFRAESAIGSERVLNAITEQMPYLAPNPINPTSSGMCKKTSDMVVFSPEKVICENGSLCTLESGRNKIILKLNGVLAPKNGKEFSNAAKMVSEDFLTANGLVVYAASFRGNVSIGDACVGGRYLSREILSRGLGQVYRPSQDTDKTIVIIGVHGNSIEIQNKPILPESEVQKLFEIEDAARKNKVGIWSLESTNQSSSGGPARVRSTNFPLLVEPLKK